MKLLLKPVLLLFLLSFFGGTKAADYSDNNYLTKNWVNFGIHTASYGVVTLGGYLLATQSMYVEDDHFGLGVLTFTAGWAGLTIPAIPISSQRKAVIKYSEKGTPRNRIARISRGMSYGALGVGVLSYGAIFFANSDFAEDAYIPLVITASGIYTASLLTYTIGVQATDPKRQSERVAFSFSPTWNPTDQSMGIVLTGTF